MNQFGKYTMMSYDEYKFYGYNDLDRINIMLKKMFDAGLFDLNYLNVINDRKIKLDKPNG